MRFTHTLLLLTALLYATAGNAVTFIRDIDVDETASGIAHDGDALWIGHLGEDGEVITKIADDDATVLDTIEAPARGCYGLGWFANMLWYLNDSPESAVFGITPLGAIVQEWDLPGEFMSGITAGDGDIWLGSYYQPSGYLYRLDISNGDSLGVLEVPGNQPRALAWQNGTIWVADGQDNMIRQVDADNGEVLDSFESPYGSPKGLSYDGRWLWLLDEGPAGNADRIYQIDSSPAVPRAVIDPMEFSFGAVTFNRESTIMVTVSNTGRAPLNVMQIQFSGNPTGYTLETPALPRWVQEYQSITFSLTFEPPGIGDYSSPYVYITTNDPHYTYYEFPIFGIGGWATQYFNRITQQDPLDFGTVRMQQELDAMQVRQFVFSNLGTPTLVIESFEATDDDFFISRDFPIDIAGGYRDSLTVWWRPTSAGLVEESFTIVTNDDRHPTVTVGLRGVVSQQYLPGGSVLWDYHGGNDDVRDGFMFIGEMSDIAGIDHPAIVAVTMNGRVLTFNSNAHDDGQILYEAQVTPPGARSPGLNDDTGYLTQREMATIIDDIDGDGYIDLVFGSDGDISSAGAAGVVLAVSGIDGSLIWSLNSAELGEAPVMEVRALPDLDGDDMPEVMVVFGENENNSGPRRVQIHNGANGYPVWVSSQQGDFRTAILGPDTNGDGICDIFAGTSFGMVYALDGATGYPIWGEDLGGGIHKIVTIEDIGGYEADDIVVSGVDGLFALDPENGEEFWAVDRVNNGVELLNVGSFSDLENEQVVVVQSNGDVLGILTGDGEVYWTRSVGNSPLDLKLINDLDGNGIPEFAIGTAGNRLSVFKGDGSDVRWSYTEGGEQRWVQSISQVEDVEGNWSVEIVCCTRNGTIRLFTGGLEATSGISQNSLATFPDSYAIRAAYPNPFNSSLRLDFDLPANLPVPVGIYDTLGRLVHRMLLIPGGGRAQAVWQPNGQLSTGMYIVRIENIPAPATRVMYVK